MQITNIRYTLDPDLRTCSTLLDTMTAHDNSSNVEVQYHPKSPNTKNIKHSSPPTHVDSQGTSNDLVEAGTRGVVIDGDLWVLRVKSFTSKTTQKKLRIRKSTGDSIKVNCRCSVTK